MRLALITVLLSCTVALATASAADAPRVVNTTRPHDYNRAQCPSGEGQCVVVTGRDVATFSLSGRPSPNSRNVRAVIYAGICDPKTVVERILRVEERRYRKSVVLLVVLEKLPAPDPSDPGVACPAIAKAFPFTIRLSHGLGRRTVRDGSTVPSMPVMTAPGR